jgi:hypothetical protein
MAPSTLSAQTNASSRWIDGTAAGSSAKLAYGWAIVSLTANAAAGFDDTTFHSGNYSMKLSTLNSTGAITVGSYRTNSPTASSAFELFLLKPNTAYTLTGWIKTNNVAASGAWIDCREFSSSFATLATTSTNKLSGTNNFIEVTVMFTTNASTVFGGVFLRNNVAGNIADAWFDDVVLSPTSSIRAAATTRTEA